MKQIGFDIELLNAEYQPLAIDHITVDINLSTIEVMEIAKKHLLVESESNNQLLEMFGTLKPTIGEIDKYMDENDLRVDIVDYGGSE